MCVCVCVGWGGVLVCQGTEEMGCDVVGYTGVSELKVSGPWRGAPDTAVKCDLV